MNYQGTSVWGSHQISSARQSSSQANLCTGRDTCDLGLWQLVLELLTVGQTVTHFLCQNSRRPSYCARLPTEARSCLRLENLQALQAVRLQQLQRPAVQWILFATTPLELILGIFEVPAA